MRNQGRLLRRWAGLSLSTALLLAAVALLQQLLAPPALAVPHVISNVEHPFDPDWLQVQVMLAHKCNGCHRKDNERTDFTSYQALIDAVDESGQRVVVPGRPEESTLWECVQWNAKAQPHCDLPDEPMMPPELEEWLTAGQQEIVHRWIAGGALEYKLPQTCNVRPLLETDFPSARECKACHPKQYKEWSRSMHAYAQHSPVFEAFNLTLIERTSGTIGTFCSRCHTPLGTALGENGSRRNVHRSRLSMEGVTCVVCHRLSKPYYKANTRHHIEPGALLEGCMFGPFEDAVKLDSTHASVGRPFIKESAFCGSCHDVTIPSGVRLEEAFSEWQNSPAASSGITCQNCHMGPVQGVPIADCNRPLGRAAEVPGMDPELIPLRRLSDHTFAGPDYSLLPDTEFPHKLDWMYEVDYRVQANLTPYQQRTLKDLRIRNRKQLEIASRKRYELLRNSARIKVSAPTTAQPGEKIKVDVSVKSIFAGHNLPTGFTAERQVWLEVLVWDSSGRVVFSSGDTDHNGDLRDEHSYEVETGKIPADKHLLNLQSKFIALTSKGTERAVVISVNRHLDPLSFLRPAPGIPASFGRPVTFRVQKASLVPLGETHKSYPVHLPKVSGDYLLRVRLNFRHLPPSLLDKIGTPHLKHLLETVVIDEKAMQIQVGNFEQPILGNRLEIVPVRK